MTEHAKRFGRRLATLRKRAGLTQAQLAEAIDTAPEIVSRIEHGASSPALDRILRIADTLGIDVRELFTGEDEHGAEAGSETTARLAAALRRLAPEDVEIVVGLAELMAKRKRR